MRLFSILVTLLPLTAGLPARRRAADLAPQVLASISELNSSVASLTTAVTNFDGSLLGVLPQSLAVITAETTLDATTLKTTAIAEQSGNFTDAESSSIVSALAGLLTPISNSLTELSSKYTTFAKTLEAPIVLLDLKILKAHTDDLITALLAKVSESNAGLLSLGQGILDSAFDAAIAVYEGEGNTTTTSSKKRTLEG